MRGETEGKADGRGVATPRRAGRAGGLPNGRAVVGGFLVAVAAVGTFAAVRGTDAGPSTRYVVARHAIAPGTTLTADDVATVALDLPADQAGRAFARTDAVVGRLSVAPVGEGELLQVSALVERARADARFQVSFAIDRARALDGAVSPGEEVTLLGTYGGTTGERTITVARGAAIVRVDDGRRSSIAGGASGELIIVVALASPDDVLAVTHAAQAGKLTLVRSTGATGAGAAVPDSYEPVG